MRIALLGIGRVQNLLRSAFEGSAPAVYIIVQETTVLGEYYLFLHMIVYFFLYSYFSCLSSEDCQSASHILCDFSSQKKKVVLPSFPSNVKCDIIQGDGRDY